MGWIREIRDGEPPLPRMFWLYGIGGLVLVALLFAGVFVGQIAFVALTMFGDRSASDTYNILGSAWLLLGLIVAVFVFVVPTGIWRSAERYEGGSAWRMLAKPGSAMVLLAFGVADGAAFQTAYSMYSMPAVLAELRSPSRTSLTVRQSLKPTAQDPWTGFWQEICGDYPGIAIEAVSKRTVRYRVDDCGPAGCSSHGPDTMIVGDNNYRIINSDSVDIWEHPAGPWRHYIRCN